MARYIIRAAFSQERMKYLEQEGTDDVIPGILEPEENNKALRKNWARLIQKIYEVDPLICPKCKDAMRIISFIEDPLVIREILMHLGLWLVRSRPPPKIHNPPNREYATADLLIQPHTDIIGTCPRPDRGATPNTPGMITYSHDVITHHIKMRDGEVCLNSGDNASFAGETTKR